ncbi:MAG: hypothetical protein JNL94_19015, partial [Planctomycetes bacterium]|nr:hypothetical protein [Planctomycetota bacterium]
FTIDLPPLGAIFLVHERAPEPPANPAPAADSVVKSKKPAKSKRKPTDGEPSPTRAD